MNSRSLSALAAWKRRRCCAALGEPGFGSFGGVWSFGGDSLIRIDVELSKRRFDGDDVIQQDAGAGVDFMAEG